MGVKRLPAAHVNTEIKAVCTCLFDEGAQRSGVGGTVDHLDELLVFETVHHAEKPSRVPACVRDFERFFQACAPSTLLSL